MDYKEIRRLVIIALFADDELMEKFVLKGGNALNIIYKIGARTSVDLDVSISEDFEDIEDAKNRLFRSLKDRFDAAGYVVFDETFEKRPSRLRIGANPKWGGYAVEFKIITRGEYEKYQTDLAALQRNATTISPSHQRKFTIDISKHEFCEPKIETELDDYTIYVYSLPMMVIEKLRAICQQLPEYELRGYQTARARDFYDIHAICAAENFDIASPENIELLKNIFEAKDVPISFLSQIKDSRDFHVTDWPSVAQSAPGNIEDFDYYFEFVLGLVKKLETAGII